MRRKIIVIFVLMLFIGTSVLPVLGNFDTNINKKNISTSAVFNSYTNNEIIKKIEETENRINRFFQDNIDLAITPWIYSPENEKYISGTINIGAVAYEGTMELEYNLDVDWTRFEYSTDGSNWYDIGLDNEGYILFDVEWDTSELSEGNYNIRTTMSDENGNLGDNSDYLTNVYVYHPPVADAEIFYSDCPNTFYFDGSNSHDSDGEIVDWVWNFCDGTTSYGPVVSHLFDDPSVTMSVSLTVTDDDGYSDTYVFLFAAGEKLPAPQYLAIVEELIDEIQEKIDELIGKISELEELLEELPEIIQEVIDILTDAIKELQDAKDELRRLLPCEGGNSIPPNDIIEAVRQEIINIMIKIEDAIIILEDAYYQGIEEAKEIIDQLEENLDKLELMGKILNLLIIKLEIEELIESLGNIIGPLTELDEEILDAVNEVLKSAIEEILSLIKKFEKIKGGDHSDTVIEDTLTEIHYIERKLSVVWEALGLLTVNVQSERDEIVDMYNDIFSIRVQFISMALGLLSDADGDGIPDVWEQKMQQALDLLLGYVITTFDIEVLITLLCANIINVGDLIEFDRNMNANTFGECTGPGNPPAGQVSLGPLTFLKDECDGKWAAQVLLHEFRHAFQMWLTSFGFNDPDGDSLPTFGLGENSDPNPRVRDNIEDTVRPRLEADAEAFERRLPWAINDP